LKDDILNSNDDNTVLKSEDEIGKFVSNQFRKMFVAYSMAINKQECRTGNLFDRSFKRLEITEHEYLQYAIFYSHYNPEKHGLTTNFKNFRFSSFSAFLSTQNTSISRDLVFEIFDGKAGFINYHNVMHEERENVQLE
jgi:putative transposase